jgi:hypothetical protein
MAMKYPGTQWIALAVIGGLWLGSLFSDPAAAQTANSPYVLSVFTKSAAGYSQPAAIEMTRCSGMLW